jgi:Adenylate and Guanylate cyclase catalytic domain
MEGVQKIETVGKTYMACGGIKSHEKTLSVN